MVVEMVDCERWWMVVDDDQMKMGVGLIR